jgi:hypothetical protein
MINFTRDDLDTHLKAAIAVLASLETAKFESLRDRAYKRTMSEYQADLIAADDPWIRRDTLEEVTPPSTGSEKINTSIGDMYRVALLANAISIAGDTILVSQGTGVFKTVPRVTMETLTIGGVDETIIGFIENKGKLIIYAKEGTFVPPGTVHYNYYIGLDGDPAAGATELDIKPQDYSRILSACAQYIREELALT